ncbi:hypothetical protein, conserved [Angomonas deanei]|uniref:Uncharacterized protein n=1 Tax=Angomonas deanei TaxID=59799 RepID=A0A7G2CB80_9TRYP|nr:hypothetical protein, conserved [Angomonas deanei]
MGTLPSREAHENPNQVLFMNFSGVVLFSLPVTRHFFPSRTGLAFQQLLDCRAHQNAKYNFDLGQGVDDEEYDPTLYVDTTVPGCCPDAVKKVMPDGDLYRCLVEMTEERLLVDSNEDLYNAKTVLCPISEAIFRRMDMTEVEQANKHFHEHNTPMYCQAELGDQHGDFKTDDELDEDYVDSFPDYTKTPLPFEDLSNKENHQYVDGRTHLVEYMGVLYVFAYNPEFVLNFNRTHGRVVSEAQTRFLRRISKEGVRELREKWNKDPSTHFPVNGMPQSLNRRNPFDLTTDIATRTFDELMQDEQMNKRARDAIVNDETQRRVYNVLQSRYERYYIPVLPVCVTGLNGLLPQSFLSKPQSGVRPRDITKLRICRFYHSTQLCERKLNCMSFLSIAHFRERAFFTGMTDREGTNVDRDVIGRLTLKLYGIVKLNDAPFLNLVDMLCLRRGIARMELHEDNKTFIHTFQKSDEGYWNDYTSLVNVPKLGFLKMNSAEKTARLRGEDSRRSVQLVCSDAKRNESRKATQQVEVHSHTCTYSVGGFRFETSSSFSEFFTMLHNDKHSGVFFTPSHSKNESKKVTSYDNYAVLEGAKYMYCELDGSLMAELFYLLSQSTCPVILSHQQIKFKIPRTDFGLPHGVFDFFGSIIVFGPVTNALVAPPGLIKRRDELKERGRLPIVYAHVSDRVRPRMDTLHQQMLEIIRHSSAVTPDTKNDWMDVFSTRLKEGDKLLVAVVLLSLHLKGVSDFVEEKAGESSSTILQQLKEDYHRHKCCFHIPYADGDTLIPCPLTNILLPQDAFIFFGQIMLHEWYHNQNQKGQELELNAKQGAESLLTYCLSLTPLLVHYTFYALDGKTEMTEKEHPYYGIFTDKVVLPHPLAGTRNSLGNMLRVLTDTLVSIAMCRSGGNTLFGDKFFSIFLLVPPKHEMLLHWHHTYNPSNDRTKLNDKNDPGWLRTSDADGDVNNSFLVTRDHHCIFSYLFDNNHFFQGSKPKFARRRARKERVKQKRSETAAPVDDYPEAKKEAQLYLSGRIKQYDSRGMTYRWNPY